MKNVVKVSVLMAVWDDISFLKEAVSSVLHQSFRDFELIIIEDASTDNSLDLLKKFADIDSRVVLMQNDGNIGLTKSLNIGLAVAKGKYVARMDANDIALKDRLRIQYEFLEKNKDVFLCGTNFDFIDLRGSRCVNNLKEFLCDSDQITKTLPKKNCFAHPTIMFRNEGILYREKFYYSQDYDFVLRLLSEGKKLANLNDRLLLFRKDIKSGISYNKRKQQRMFAKKARELYHQREKGKDDGYENFSPERILKLRTKESGRTVAIRDEIISCLRKGDFSEARKIYEHKFKAISGKKMKAIAPVFLFVEWPLIYKLYRRIFYGK